jgi:hypothetical protein
MRKEIRTTFFVFLVFWGVIADCAAASNKLFFAGFSFAGDAIQNAQRYPVATELSETSRNLDIALSDQLTKLKRKDLVISKDVATKGIDSIALAFSLTEESVEEIPYGEDYLSIYRVIAQILIFDFESKKIIATYPTLVQHQDIKSVKMTKQDHTEVFKKIYLDTTFEGNIFAQWVNRLETVKFKEANFSYLGIRSVTLDDGVIDFVPMQLRANNAYQTQVAQNFEFLLSSIQNVALLPYTTGQTIGKNMLARFSSGTYELKMPPADFAIDILVRPFKSVSELIGNRENIAFGSFITLKLESEGLHKVYVDSKFKNINIVTLDRTERIVLDKWSSYQISQRALFSKLAKQISIRDKDVIGEMSPSPDIDNQLMAFQEVLKKCN